MSQHAKPDRPSLFPDGIGLIELYWSSDVLENALGTCRTAGWRIVELDVSDWHDSDRLHDDLVAQLPLPDYYGRNLDALLDVLRDITDGSAGTVTEPGMAIVLHNVERLASTDSARLTAVIEVLTIAALHGLRHGWPSAILAKSGDPELALEPVSATPVVWNRSEHQRIRRG